MKSFTRKRSKKTIVTVLWSTFLLMSAFAVFTPECNAKEEALPITKETPADSILTARYVFENLHTSALEILPKTVRLDMLDYWDVDSVYKASNAMEGLSWLEKVDDNYLKVKISNVSDFEIKILPGRKEKIVMTVYTVGDDVQSQDSEVKFYDCALTELPVEKYLEMPRIKDFFEIPKGSLTSMKEIESMIPFPTIAFSANADNNNLEARLTVAQYINQDDWNIAKLFVKPFITLEWKKEKYKY